MRPREREEEEDETPSPALAAESSPAPPRFVGNLSSMVVRPSESGGGSDHGAGDANRRRDSSPEQRRRDSPPPPPSHPRGSSPHFRRRGSPMPFRRRGSPPSVRPRGSPPGVHRRDLSPAFPRHYSPPAFRRHGSPTNFHPRSQRFKEEPGYGLRGGSNSPPPRQRLDDSRYDPDFDHSVEPHFGRGFRGRGKAGRFRDISPRRGRGRGGRSFGRGYDVPERSLSPIEGEHVHRNDPNLSPREGDWICRNPSCGNLNFARRSYCNNCNQDRFGPEHNRFSRSPRRGYFNSAPPYESPPRISGPPMGRGRRDINGYRPPRYLGVDDSRDFGSGSPPLRHGDRVPYDMRERPAYHEDEYRERDKFLSPVHDEWDRGDRHRDGPGRNRRGYEPRARAPSHDRWVHDSRERSRSPFGDRPLKGAYMGRGRGGRGYSDSYAGRGRGDDFHPGRGRGFRHGDDSFRGKGRGDRPGMSRGRNSGIY